MPRNPAFPTNVGLSPYADAIEEIVERTRTRVFDIRDADAVGDGVADDSTPYADALDELRGNGGILLLPPGFTFLLNTGATWNTAADGPLIVLAWGSIIDYRGLGQCLDLQATTSAGDLPRAQVHGGHWFGTADGVAAFRLTDITGATLNGVRVEDYSTGAAVIIRNLDFWSEQTTLTDLVTPNCQHAIDFEPASVSGGLGTESFARTVVRNIRMGQGVANEPLIRCRGGVYDSTFEDITGNITDDVDVFHLSGSMGGTVIRHVGVENNVGGSGTGTIFDWGTFTGSAPQIEGPVVLRNSIVLNSGTPLARPDVIANPVSGRSTADQTLTQSSTTLQDVTNLTVEVSANAVYEVDATIFYSASTTADLRLGFLGPSGAVMKWVPFGPAPGVSSGTNAGVNVARHNIGDPANLGGTGAGAANQICARPRGLLKVGATAGTFKIQAAQWSSEASDVVIHAESSLQLKRVL